MHESHDDIPALRARIAALEADAEIRALLCEQLPLVGWTTDRDLRFTSTSGANLHLFALTPDQVVGTTMAEYFRTADPAYAPIAAARRALAGESVRYQHDWLGRSYTVCVAPLRSAELGIVGTIGIALDVTDNQRAEEAIRAGEQRYRELFENATDMVYTHDLNGRITSINRAGERLLGYSRAELLTMNIEDVLAPEHRDPALQIIHLRLRGQGPAACELHALARSGERLMLEVSMSVVRGSDGLAAGLQGVCRDLTNRKRTEEQIRQTQKMEAIGVLAGGIAHDFNNLLTGILGNAYLLKGRTGRSEITAEAVHGIIESAERASQLTQQLLGFARQTTGSPRPIDLHEIIRKVSALVTRTFDPRIRIVCSFQAERADVIGDAGQLYQVFLNLALNARDAMPDGGELRFSTRIRDGVLAISVRDTGRGIPDSIRSRIFEPFFTTKENERGAGLGLAMVYGIVRNHGGTIDVESGARGGTAFHMTLPVSQERAANAPETATHKGSVKPSRGRVLIIDDEAVVRRVLTRMLNELGFEVVGSADSIEGIDMYRSATAAIDLVILDIVMPKLGGVECLARLREINPDIRAVLSSGYDPASEVQELVASGLVAFLPKPYTMATLEHVVRKVLETRAALTA
ncbi:MAG TPA: PAS domain S-box protein [Bryobacteraceae bacterium]|nr:PAS domain S-box protein [Bryobacteraceae bacterium]